MMGPSLTMIRTLLGQHFPSLCIKHIGDVPKADTPGGRNVGEAALDR